MYLIMLFRVMNPHQKCLQDKVKHWNGPKQVMPKSQGLSRSLEIKNEHLIQNFKLCSIKHGHNYIIFKSAVKHRQLSYGYHRGQTCQTLGIHISVCDISTLLFNNKYVDANLDASDNAISGNEPSSEMLTSQSQKLN